MSHQQGTYTHTLSPQVSDKGGTGPENQSKGRGLSQPSEGNSKPQNPGASTGQDPPPAVPGPEALGAGALGLECQAVSSALQPCPRVSGCQQGCLSQEDFQAPLGHEEA